MVVHILTSLDIASARAREQTRSLRNKDVAAKYFLTFYPGADEAAAVFGTSVGEVPLAGAQLWALVGGQ